jgi:hypothetical protein
VSESKLIYWNDEYRHWYIPQYDDPDRPPVCRYCQHWDAPESLTGHANVDEPWKSGFGACRLTDYEAWPGETLATAADADCYRAVLRTAPDFGCIQFARTDSVEG